MELHYTNRLHGYTRKGAGCALEVKALIATHPHGASFLAGMGEGNFEAQQQRRAAELGSCWCPAASRK